GRRGGRRSGGRRRFCGGTRLDLPDLLRRDVPDGAHLRVAVGAGAGVFVGVAVGEDVGQGHGGAAPVLRAVEGVRGVAGGTLRVETGDGGLPADHFADRPDHLLTGLGDVVVAHHGDAEGVVVEAADVRALDVLVQPAEA